MTTDGDEFLAAVYESWVEAVHEVFDCPFCHGHVESCIMQTPSEEVLQAFSDTLMDFRKFFTRTENAKADAVQMWTSSIGRA